MARTYTVRALESMDALRSRKWTMDVPILELVKTNGHVREKTLFYRKGAHNHNEGFYSRNKKTDVMYFADGLHWIVDFADKTWLDMKCPDPHTLPITCMIDWGCMFTVGVTCEYSRQCIRRENYLVFGSRSDRLSGIEWLERCEFKAVQHIAILIMLVANRLVAKSKTGGVPALPVEMWYAIASMLSFYDVLQ